MLLKPFSFFPENHLILLECSPHFSLLRAARQVQPLPLWGLFKSKLHSSRQVFTECIKKHIPLHYLLSATNNCKRQSISGHKLVMVGNTPLVPVSRNRLRSCSKDAGAHHVPSTGDITTWILDTWPSKPSPKCALVAQTGSWVLSVHCQRAQILPSSLGFSPTLRTILLLHFGVLL